MSSTKNRFGKKPTRQTSASSSDSKSKKEEASYLESFIKEKMNNLMSLGYACGVADGESEYNKVVEDEDVKITWRMDPIRSKSDWVLVVKDGRQNYIYHVHQSSLVYGQRKSGFFLKKFDEVYADSNRVDKKPITEVLIDASVAPFIPTMLDYVYEDKLDLTISNAAALRKLSNQFDIRTLYALVSSFIQQDITFNTVAGYIEQADIVNDKELSKVCVMMALQFFNKIPDNEISKIPIDKMQNLVADQKLNVSTPERLSQRIAAYIKGRNDIDHETFYFLTHANILPSFHPKEAMWYLSYVSENFPSTLTEGEDRESTLQYRCVVAVTKNWQENLLGPVESAVKRTSGSYDSEDNQGRLFRDGDSSNDERARDYMILPDEIKVDILQMALLKSNSGFMGNVNMKRQSRSEVANISRAHKDVREIPQRSAGFS